MLHVARFMQCCPVRSSIGWGFKEARTVAGVGRFRAKSSRVGSGGMSVFGYRYIDMMDGIQSTDFKLTVRTAIFGKETIGTNTSSLAI